MNSCPPKSSPMPFIVIIILLLMVLSGLLIYFFMFYKPSQDLCSNLYASNICTTEMCTTLEVCPAVPTVEWKPVVKAASSKFLGYDVTPNITGTFGSAYTAGLASLESNFDSNVCATLTGGSMNISPYNPTAPADELAPDKSTREGKINCIKMIKAIDTEIDKNPPLFEKKKLLETRRAVIDLCTDDSTPDSLSYKTDFPATEITSKTGKISKIFCPTTSST